jgi:acyl carrier protein
VRPGTARFFLGPEEQDWLGRLPERDRNREQLRLWTVKEALFKADPDNHSTVLLDYRVDPAARSGGAARPGGPAATYLSGRLPGAHVTVAATFRPRPGAARPAAAAGHSPPPLTDIAQHTHEGATSMQAQDISFDDIAQRISSTLNIPVEKLTPGTKLQELAADSFLLVEMSVDLQEEFDVVFNQAQLREVSTLGDLAGLMASS